MTQSEVARLREQIRLEYEASKRALTDKIRPVILSIRRVKPLT